MRRLGSADGEKWNFDGDCCDQPDACFVARHRALTELRRYVLDGKASCMIVGLPGSGRHVLRKMIVSELRAADIDVQSVTLKDLGVGVEAFQQLISKVSGSREKLGTMTLHEAKEAFVGALEKALNGNGRKLCLVIDSFDACHAIPDCNDFLDSFFDTQSDRCWQRLGFIPVLISRRCPEMILKYVPGLTSFFVRYYEQHTIYLNEMDEQEFKAYVGFSKRPLTEGDYKSLVVAVGHWPGLAEIVLKYFNSTSGSMQDAVNSAAEDLSVYCKDLQKFLSEFGESYGLVNGKTLWDWLVAFALEKPLPPSRCLRSIYDVMKNYGLGLYDDTGKLVLQLPDTLQDYIAKNHSIGQSASSGKSEAFDHQTREASGESSFEVGVVTRKITIRTHTNQKKQILCINSKSYRLTRPSVWRIVDRLLKAAMKYKENPLDDSFRWIAFKSDDSQQFKTVEQKSFFKDCVETRCEPGTHTISRAAIYKKLIVQ